MLNIMNNIILKLFCATFISVSLVACNKYLDVVPNNAATLDHAFRMRSTAEKVLFTCYSYVPYSTKGDVYNIVDDPALLAGDEWWIPDLVLPTVTIANIIRGNQNVVSPHGDSWEGRNRGVHLYNAIRECNIFLENIDRVPDLKDDEKIRWVSEVKFLKAYYLFLLTRMYGPIVVPKENLSISASTEEVKQPRLPVDSCFSYIEKLIDESIAGLPDGIEYQVSEMGRLTKAIALSIKAKVLVTAASPLFNGNPDYKGFTNHDGTPLFNSTFDVGKWEKAAEACKQAIDFCHSQGYKLHYFSPSEIAYPLSDTTLTKLSVRTAISKKWNSEVIWGLTTRMIGHTQSLCFPRGLDPENRENSGVSGYLAPTLKIAHLFYSNNGVPITEDKTWDYAGRFELQEADSSDRYHLSVGYTTAKLHFNREPRFYANIGFDGGLWFGQGRYDDTYQWIVMNKRGQATSPINPRNFSSTGYFTKKLININTALGTGSSVIKELYPWPMIRLADIYLLYAEALNEAYGPGDEVYTYLNLVRERAGIPTIEEAWTNYSKYPEKYKSQNDLRDIIHQERGIELVFEGSRFWDLRRWKEAIEEYNKPVAGWDIDQSNASGYYRSKTLFTPVFTTRDYFWPLSERVILSNRNLVQNPGW